MKIINKIVNRHHENNLDEIVFTGRNKEYGAYLLRKSYTKTMFFSIITSATAFIVFFLISFQLNFNIEYSNYIEKQNTVNYEPFDTKISTQLPPLPYNQKSYQNQLQKKHESNANYSLAIADSIVKNITEPTNNNQENNTDSIKKDSISRKNNYLLIEIQEESPESAIFIVVDVMPSFSGGKENLKKFIESNLKIPQIALQQKIFGIVYVSFCVTDSGAIEKVYIAKGLHPDLDKEAIRVIKLMPKWLPGIHESEAVNVWFTLPIKFLPN